MSPHLLCLLMIVNDNENASILKECMQNILSYIPQIDYYLVSDTTPSHDETRKTLLETFEPKDIKGEIYTDAWIDYEHNTNLLLLRAQNRSEFILFWNPHYRIRTSVMIPALLSFSENALVAPIHDGDYQFYETILIGRNDGKWRFSGKNDSNGRFNHESPSFVSLEGEIVNTQPWDIMERLQHLPELMDAYEKGSKDYAFVCAQYFQRSGKHDQARIWYEKVLACDGMLQEKYCACINLYNYCKQDDIYKGLHFLVRTLEYDRERVEGLYELIRHYCDEQMFRVAYGYSRMIENLFISENESFWRGKRYANPYAGKFGIPLYMIKIGFFIQDVELVTSMFRWIIKKKQIQGINEITILEILHYFSSLHQRINDEGLAQDFQDYVNLLQQKGLPIQNILQQSLPQSLQRPEIIRTPQVFKNILIYAGHSHFKWNYTLFREKALGGSETAYMQLALHLPKDYTIYIMGDVYEETFENIVFVPKTASFDAIKFDCVIVCRYLDYFCRYKHQTRKILLWAHDVIFSSEELIPDIVPFIDNCICLTEWHKTHFEGRYPQLKGKIIIINNGIDVDMSISKFQKQVNSFVYSSCSERGLVTLLRLWTDICKALPDAVLYICGYSTLKNAKDGEEIESLMKPFSNIHYLGKKNKKDLYQLLGKCEYWLYPTHFAETSCITALEMMAHQVLCLYYPLAGLPDTIGPGNGIVVAPGNELTTILGLTPHMKHQTITNGIERVNAFLWKNKIHEWEPILGIVATCDPVKIALFSSFNNIHYEVMGFILYYAKTHHLTAHIYTSCQDELKFLDFYRARFDPVIFQADRFSKHLVADYQWIFLITDDDWAYDFSWHADNLICINHVFVIRRAKCAHYLNVGPFCESPLPYALHTYPIYAAHEKQKTNIVSIIGSYKNLDTSLINRLESKNHEKIILWIFSRTEYHDKIQELDPNKFIVCYQRAIATEDMINYLKDCSYIFIHSQGDDHWCKNVQSVSGSLGLTFSVLCKPIIIRSTNQFFGFKECIEFDLEGQEPIILDEIDFEMLEKERTRHMERFTDFMDHLPPPTFTYVPLPIKIPRKLYFTWETKTFSGGFQTLIDSWKVHNPHYEIEVFDSQDREHFIRDRFGATVYRAYRDILPGAFKADLWRCCILYERGGFYADIDTECLGSIDDFVTSLLEFISVVDLNENPDEGHHNVSNGFIGSIPGHPILQKSIEMIVRHVENDIIPSSRLDFSGPGVLGRALNIFRGENELASVKEISLFLNQKIALLAFAPETEMVYSRINHKTLFQNKNGSEKIQKIYQQEVQSLAMYHSWLNTYPIRRTPARLALMICGQFRTFRTNLRNNLQQFRFMLQNHQVYVFLLTDQKKNGNFSKAHEQEIIDILVNEYHCIIGFIKHAEDVIDEKVEQDVKSTFYKTIRHPIGHDATSFAPILLYRNKILNDLKNAYANEKGFEFDVNMYFRCFDIQLLCNIEPDKMTCFFRNIYRSKHLYGSADTLFIGSSETFDSIFSRPEQIYHDDVWDDPKFVAFALTVDSFLATCRDTYAPEIQYLARAFFNTLDYQNIRVDYNHLQNPCNKDLPFFIWLDPERQKFV